MNQLVTLFLLIPFVLALSPGEQAPDFALKNQSGKTIHLSDYRGKPVILYFYPKDDTPGCTKEASNFRDAFSKYQKMGAVILGVSTQDEASHVAFQKKYNLPFDLVVDPNGLLASLYGVERFSDKGLYKRESMLIGKDGRVVKVYGNVDPEKHAGEVLADIEVLSKTR